MKSNYKTKGVPPSLTSEIKVRIFKALKQIKFGHFESIAKVANLEPPQVWKRLSEMRKSGYVKRTGQKPTSTGKLASVYMVAAKYC